MRKATKKDYLRVKEILTAAFEDNKSSNYVLNNKKKLPKLIQYSIEKGKLFGDIWINDSSTACAILIDPKKKKTSLKSIFFDVNFIFRISGISRMKKVMEKEKITNETLPKDIDYIHLWFLGVFPFMQAKGEGGKLMKEIIEKYRGKKQAICLETSTERNSSFYKKLGFENYETKNFGFDFLFFIKNI
jgi:N-acetylglutamate synthase-like GNAT family acetyltransferase